MGTESSRTMPSTGARGAQLCRRWLAIPVLLVLLSAGCTGDQPAEEGGIDQAQQTEQPQEEGQEEDTGGGLAEEQVLNVFAFFEPPSWDPARQGPATFGGNGLRRQYTEALLKPEPDLEEPGVTTAAAEDFEVSDDGLTYTFDLRDDAAFNDGEPVTADDFVFAWRRLIDPRVQSPMGRLFAGVVEGGEEAAAMGADADEAELEAALDGLGLEAVDEDTFEVTLAHPAPYFEWIAAETAGAPVREDVLAEHGAQEWATSPDTLVTNGPFMLTETTENEATFEPNPHYAGEEPTLDRLVAGFGLGPAPRWTKYLNDELDISNGPPPESRGEVLQDPTYEDEIIRFPELSIQWLGFNTQAAPFDDPRARLAVAKAIDREAYNEVGADTGFPTTSLVPEGMPGHNPDFDAQAFDPEAAQELLAEAGVDAADFEGVTLVTAPPQETNALFIQDQLSQNLGIDIQVDSIGESAVLDQRVADGDYHMRQTFIGHAANYPDPQDFFDVFLSTSRANIPGWANEEYDDLVERADTTTDMDERLDLYDEAHRLLAEEAPVAFLVQLERVFWVKPWVQGITRTPIDTAFMPGDIYSNRIEIVQH